MLKQNKMTREQLIYEIKALFMEDILHNKGTVWLEDELNKLITEYDRR